jgi:DNA-binding PadR family transcriptional regulator
MTNKEPNEENSFKELGSLQEKVLFFLAENPQNHKQAIQQGIKHPAEQYGSILKAVDALEKLGFAESKKTPSQKKVQIKIYSCTDSGVFYALAKNPCSNIPKILDAYKLKFEFCKSFRQLYDVWGHDYFAMYIRDAVELLPIVQKNGFGQALPYLLMKAIEEMKNIDPKIRKKNAREALKLFPETKQMLKEWQKNINELIES